MESTVETVIVGSPKSINRRCEMLGERTSCSNHAAARRRWRSEAPMALVLLIASLSMAVSSNAAREIPSGTIELSGKSVAAGIGYSWASGTVIFHGKKYPVQVQGLSVLHVGASDYTASGTVYNLARLSDIDGVYTAVSAGAALGGGASATAMKNSHGVLIEMVGTHAGVNFSLGPKGVTINLKP